MNRAHGTWVLLSVMAGSIAAGSARAAAPPDEAYQLHCSGCHGPRGAGIEGFIPSLRGLAGLLDAEGGRQFLIQAPGVAQAPLGDDELANLINWLLPEIAGASTLVPYTASEIGALRRSPLRDPASARP